jgi:DivIVA domain-containing protein
MGPEEIEGKEFTVAIRGYDQDEVRTYLRELADQCRYDAPGVDASAVASREFVVGLRGYERDEVRAFLEQLAAGADAEDLSSAAVDEPQPDADPFGLLGTEVASVLRSAQDAARAAIETADAEAARRIAVADSEAARLLDEARMAADDVRREADEIRAGAEADAAARLDRVRRLQQDVLDQLEHAALAIEQARSDLAAGGDATPEGASSAVG